MAISLQQVGDSNIQPLQEDSFSLYQDPDPVIQDNDSAVGYFIDHPGDIIRIQTSVIKQIQTLPGPVAAPPKKMDIVIPEWNFNTNFFTENELTRTVTSTGYLKSGKKEYIATSAKPENIVPQGRNTQNIDWLLGIFIFITLLFIWIRLFYGKYFSLLANAVGSFHISAKLFRERNVMVRRVSIVLDFIYLVVLSVLTFESAIHFDWFTSGLSRFNEYMLLLNIIMLYALIRIALLRFTGFLFLKHNLFSEYIHNSFVINKGTGIVLFPVVIVAHYFPFQLVSIVLVTGFSILIISLTFKAVRAYQIIRRKDIVLFYLILYLCTLEFLPLLIGYKVIISLI